MHKQERKRGLVNGIMSLWRNWTLAMGFLIILTVLSRYLHAKYVPFAAVILEIILLYLDRRNRMQKSPICFRLPYLVSHILLYTAIIVTVILILFSLGNITDLNGQPVNDDAPFATILILGPVAVAVSACYLYKKNNPGYCKACIDRNGNAIDRGIIGAIYNKEAYYQTKLLLILSVVVTAESWIYAQTRYNNFNYNQADAFFLTWLPAIFMGLSVLYLGGRYKNITLEYASNKEVTRIIEQQGTRLRFLAVCNDKIMLCPPDMNSNSPLANDHRLDVPLKITLPYREHIAPAEAERIFAEKSGIANAQLQFIHKSHDYSMYNNIFNYVVFCTPEQLNGSALKGEHFTLSEVTQMISEGLVSTEVSALLKRIYTIAMAWKTYDDKGNRLYAIKHYRPTFRIKDMKNWDVDYTDNNWLLVSAINQDSRFFRLRKIWKKYVKGLGMQ